MVNISVNVIAFGFNKYAIRGGDSINLLGYNGWLLNENKKPIANVFIIINPIKNIDAQF